MSVVGLTAPEARNEHTSFPHLILHCEIAEHCCCESPLHSLEFAKPKRGHSHPILTGR